MADLSKRELASSSPLKPVDNSVAAIWLARVAAVRHPVHETHYRGRLHWPGTATEGCRQGVHRISMRQRIAVQLSTLTSTLIDCK